MTEIRPLKEVRDEASQYHVRLALQAYGEVARAAVKLQVHENTIRHYMKRAGITPENVREWKDERMRQKAIEFNGNKIL